MIYISHRGNIFGRNIEKENTPDYIDNAIKNNYDVEIDIWYINNNLYLGHDEPEHNIDIQWLLNRIYKLWIHCKNIESFFHFNEMKYDFNYFWHQSDDVVFTSKGYLWTYPGKKLSKNSIAVLPEIHKFDNIFISYGICSDFIEEYKNIE